MFLLQALCTVATPQHGDLKSLPSAASTGMHEPVEAKQEYLFFNRESLDLPSAESFGDTAETQLDVPSPPTPYSQSGWDFRSPSTRKALFTPEPAPEKSEDSEAAPSAAPLCLDGYCNPEPEIHMEESRLYFGNFAFAAATFWQLLEVHVLEPEAPNLHDQAVADHGPELESEVEKEDEVLSVPVEPAPKRRRSAAPPSVDVPPEAIDTDQARSGPILFFS